MGEPCYTRGTRGRPKGRALTHRNLHLHAIYAALVLRMTDADTILHVVPLFHVNGWGAPHWMTLSGGRHVMLRKFDPTALLELVATERVTHLLAVPTIFNALVNHPHRSRIALTSLKDAIIGGAPASPSLVEAIERELGCTAIVGYGLSETSPVLAIARPRVALTASEPAEMTARRKAMTGYAMAGADLRVVDGDRADVQADGEQIGEIVVRSNGVVDGDYREPGAAA